MSGEVSPSIRYLRWVVWAICAFIAIFLICMFLEIGMDIEIPDIYIKVLSILFHSFLMWVIWRNYNQYEKRQSKQHKRLLESYFSMVRAGAPDDMNPYRELAKESKNFQRQVRFIHICTILLNGIFIMMNVAMIIFD